MRTPHLATVASFALLTGCAAYAAPPEPKPAMQSHAMPMADHSAHQQMMERAQNAKTPAEREQLMKREYGHDEGTYGVHEGQDGRRRHDVA